jgi:CheY-like chemotaxis protein
MSNQPDTDMKRRAVLLVEDEPMLRMVAAEVLSDEGLHVYEAGNGADGLAFLQNHDDIGLLLTDVKMPVMNGYELAKASLVLKPAVKILLMTGYAHEPLPPEIAAARIPILRKPFDVDRLPQLANEMTGWLK